MNKEIIPIFFSSDDNYIPFLSVAINSLISNASKEYNYEIIILNSGLSSENIQKISKYSKENVNIKFEDVRPKIKDIIKDLEFRLRDYYSISIFYRLFIPSLFKKYKKAIYLDADIVLVDDISKLYNEDIDNFLVAGVPDEVVNNNVYFREYSVKSLDLEPGNYFNSGVLLMNLEKFREEKIEEKFLHILSKYNFDVIAPDQDYLNFLCKGKVKYIDRGWDRMPNPDKNFNDEDLHLIHFNMFQKPWNYDNVLYEDHFWKYANQTEFCNEINAMKAKYTVEDINKDKQGEINLVNQSRRISKSEFTFKNIIDKDYFNFMYE